MNSGAESRRQGVTMTRVAPRSASMAERAAASGLAASLGGSLGLDHLSAVHVETRWTEVGRAGSCYRNSAAMRFLPRCLLPRLTGSAIRGYVLPVNKQQPQE